MLRSMIPWRERVPATFSRFENEMEDLMERWFNPGAAEEWNVTRFTPALNLAETDTGYDLSVELPGLKPEEVKVEFNEGNLLISGEKQEEKEEKGKTFHRIERRHGEFRRVVRLPGKVDEEHLEATFSNGVLHVTVPKSEEARPKQIPVKG